MSEKVVPETDCQTALVLTACFQNKMIGLVLRGVSVACNFLKTKTTDKLYQRIGLYFNLLTEFNLARYHTTLFVEFWFRKNRTTYDKTRLYQTTTKRHKGSIVCSTKLK